MRVVVKKTDILQGVITPPGSKSEAVRAIMFGLLSRGESRINNLPQGEDITHAIEVARAMGAKITQEGPGFKLCSEGLPFSQVSAGLYTGNSGITTRFVLPLLGLRENSQQPIIVDCGDQMRARPMGSLLNALNNLGMEIVSLNKNDSLPIQVSGKLMGGKTSVEGITSQYLSALLIALPLAANQSEITVMDLHERPYVDITLAWLTRQGVSFMHRRDNPIDTFIIPGGQQYQPFEYTLPGDYSSASYFIAAGVMFPGEITLKGLNLNDAQGDKQLIEIVKSMGADIICTSSHIHIKGGKPLTGIKIDANAFPDLLPTIAVLGTVASGQTHITNVPQARLKETDRIHSMTQGLRKLGAKIIENPDGMIIERSALLGTSVKGYSDHRTVMALTLAGMIAEGDTHIDDAESINKTYPSFVEDIKQLGGKLEVRHD